MEEIRVKAQEVFRQVFDDPQLVLREDMTAQDVPGWDSLAHINLVVAMERTFHIRFATAEVARLKETGQNVGTLLKIIGAKTKPSAS